MTEIRGHSVKENNYNYVNEERKVKIMFVDGTHAIEYIESIDDEEETYKTETGE